MNKKDLSDFSQMLTKITVEPALNGELEALVCLAFHV